MQIRYLFLLITYVILLSLCFYYKHQRDDLNDKLTYIKVQSDKIQNDLKNVEKENTKKQQQLDRHIKRINAAPVSNDCQESFDYLINEMQS